MLRPILAVVALSLAFGASAPLAQPKKAAAPAPAAAKTPTPKDRSINLTVFMRDAAKNEVMLATRLWPDNPDYTAASLQRFFAVMKALEPPFKQDDDVAYTWAQKGKVAKCVVYLEAPEAGAKSGFGAIVGCEANGVSQLAVPIAGDPKQTVSGSQSPSHVADVVEMFKKQSERAKSSLPK